MKDEFGFESIKSKHGLYIHRAADTFVIALIYVDNALFFGPDKTYVKALKAQFMEQWES
jgi:hypothetical protein